MTDSIAPDAELDISSMTDLIASLERIDVYSKTAKLAEELYELFSHDEKTNVLIFTSVSGDPGRASRGPGGVGQGVHLTVNSTSGKMTMHMGSTEPRVGSGGDAGIVVGNPAHAAIVRDGDAR